MLYNGESGKKSAFNKWFFYIFYPGHLLIIGLIRLALHI
ncbi:MAG: conjugal transfer protein TraX [archaeon]|nr:conjugal transfer protein TraX [archaeon]